jgi:poly(hydroxyalkanoate) granule-associated protein
MKKESDVRAELRESAHKIWLAGLGALAVAGEEGKTLFRTLVDKGEQVESRGVKQVAKVRGRVKDAGSNVSVLWDKVQRGFDEQVADALHRLGVPSRAEIANLTKRVEELTKSIDKVGRKPAPPKPVAPKPAPKPKATPPAGPAAKV